MGACIFVLLINTMDLNLNGKRAVVCGSTQGIGRAIALEMARLGASVTLVARNEEKLREVQQELDKKHRQYHDYIVADFDDPEGLKPKVVEHAKMVSVEIVVNNTGGPPGGSLVDAHPYEFARDLYNHLFCTQILVQSFV